MRCKLLLVDGGLRSVLAHHLTKIIEFFGVPIERDLCNVITLNARVLCNEGTSGAVSRRVETYGLRRFCRSNLMIVKKFSAVACAALIAGCSVVLCSMSPFAHAQNAATSASVNLARCKGAVFVQTDVNEPRPSEASARRLVKSKWSDRVRILNGRRYAHFWTARDVRQSCRQRANGWICEVRAKPCKTFF